MTWFVRILLAVLLFCSGFLVGSQYVLSELNPILKEISEKYESQKKELRHFKGWHEVLLKERRKR